MVLVSLCLPLGVYTVFLASLYLNRLALMTAGTCFGLLLFIQISTAVLYIMSRGRSTTEHVMTKLKMENLIKTGKIRKKTEERKANGKISQWTDQVAWNKEIHLNYSETPRTAPDGET